MAAMPTVQWERLIRPGSIDFQQVLYPSVDRISSHTPEPIYPRSAVQFSTRYFKYPLNNRYLKKIHPDKDCQNNLVCFSTDVLVLLHVQHSHITADWMYDTHIFLSKLDSRENLGFISILT